MSETIRREWRFYLDDMTGFAEIDDDTLWSVIQDDVPNQLPLLKAVKTDTQP